MRIKSFKNIFALVFLSFLASCGKPKLPDSAYTISTVIQRDTSVAQLWRHGQLFYGYKDDQRFYRENEVRTMYSWFKDHHYITTDVVELEFPQIENVVINEKSWSQQKNYRIGAKSINKDNLKAYYVKWFNRPEWKPDYSKSNISGRLPWEIGKYTDSLETNLSLKEINRLYPNFKGAYIQNFPKKIVIDHSKAYDHFRLQEAVIFEY